MGEDKKLITKGRFELKYRGTTCLNCGQPLDVTDKYCPNCSQVNSTKKLTLKDFFNEFMSGLINYDSKLFKTLYTMMLRPGAITKDYIGGKRISYTNPFRFLFSLAFIYFLLFAYSRNFSDYDDKLNLKERIEERGIVDIDFGQEDLIADSLGRTKKIKEIIGNDSIHFQNEEIAENLQQLDSLGAIVSKVSLGDKRLDSLMINDPRRYVAEMYSRGDDGFFAHSGFFFSKMRKDSLTSFSQAINDYGVVNTLKSRMAFKASTSVLKVLSHPGSWLNDTIGKLPFVVFLFLPLFTVFVSLAYIRKKYSYTDHLIFSFHNQSLLFILLILSSVIDFSFGTETIEVAFLLFTIYLFQSMRKFYGQGIFKTILKYIFLNTVFLILATITIIMLSLGSAVTY